MSDTEPELPHDAPEAAEETVRAESEQPVRLQRSVRFGRVIVGTAVLGVVIAVFLTMLFPVNEAEYTLIQIVGFMALVGAAIGLAVGAILALVLNRIAGKQQGTAIAKRRDVG